MDKKVIIIVAVVAVVIVAAAAVLLLNNKGGGDDDVKGLSIISRVNSEGSGIILSQSEDPSSYITVQTTKPAADAKYIKNDSTGNYYVFNVAGWGGKVFATPGAATIQHVQLMELASLMGLKYASYSDGTTTKADTLYYVAGVPSFAEFVNKEKTSPVCGFIIWEAQVSVATGNGYNLLALTNDLFDGHTCCIIGASNKYLNKETEAIETFLSVYAKSVDAINAAIANPTSSAYSELLSISLKRVSMPDGDYDKEKAVKEALANVLYLYADDAKGGLSSLESDIAKLAEDLYDAHQINNSAKDLGFTSYAALADKFVDNSYLSEALKGGHDKLDSKKTINVAVIGGDIHQIAIWYAYDKGMFDDANLNVVISSQSNGPAVYGLLANGETDIGFLGAPPMTIRSMNAGDIHA
ncbi:MAG: hypothetical protein IJ856_07200 [Candidatus Methanomethylophilaceae archaeon]|nr:hypothetical protein [Candidatus Methanomethylophilaceae archaeon]